MGQPSVILFEDPNALESIVENLSSNTTYQFQIRAINEYGAGPLSNNISLTTHPPSSKFTDTLFIHHLISHGIVAVYKSVRDGSWAGLSQGSLCCAIHY